MNKYTILDIPTATDGDGNTYPVIADADVSVADNGKYIAYSKTFVPGVNTKWTRGPDQVLAVLHENKPGQYFVVADQDFIDTLDPSGDGKNTTELGRDCLHYRVSGQMLVNGELTDFTDVSLKLDAGSVPAKMPSKLTPWVVQGMTITSAKRSAPGSIAGVDMATVVEDENAGPRLAVIE